MPETLFDRKSDTNVTAANKKQNLNQIIIYFQY